MQESLSELHTVECSGKFVRYVKLRKYAQDLENMWAMFRKIHVNPSMYSDKIKRKRYKLWQKLVRVQTTVQIEKENVRLEFGFNVFS
jgi:hypothetical protein